MVWWNPSTWFESREQKQERQADEFADRVVAQSKNATVTHCKSGKCKAHEIEAAKTPFPDGKAVKTNIQKVPVGRKFYHNGRSYVRMSENYVRRNDGDVVLMRQLDDNLDMLHVWLLYDMLTTPQHLEEQARLEIQDVPANGASVIHCPVESNHVHETPTVVHDYTPAPSHVQDHSPSHHSYDSGHSSYGHSHHSSHDSHSHSSYDSGSSSSYDSGSSSCDSGGGGGGGD